MMPEKITSKINSDSALAYLTNNADKIKDAIIVNIFLIFLSLYLFNILLFE